MGKGLVAFLGPWVSDLDLVQQVGLFHYAILKQWVRLKVKSSLLRFIFLI